MAQRNAAMRHPLFVTEDEIRPLLGLDNAEERVRAYISEKFRAQFPNPECGEEERVLQLSHEHALKQLKRAQRQENGTFAYRVEHEADPQHQRNLIDTFIGALAFIVLAAAMLIVPGIATMLIVEAKKIAVVADQPVFGLAFGAMALAGVFSSLAIRSTLATDEGRRRYDKSLIAVTIGAFITWAVIAAMAAYPLEFGGGDPIVDAMGNVTATSGFELEPPMMLLFVVTAVLDLAAAPTLHQFARDHLTPRPVKRLISDNEYEGLTRGANKQLGLVQMARFEATETAQFYRDYRMSLESWRSAEAQHIERGLALLQRLQADLEAIRDAAAAEFLRHPTPSTPFTEPQRPNGQLS